MFLCSQLPPHAAAAATATARARAAAAAAAAEATGHATTIGGGEGWMRAAEVASAKKHAARLVNLITSQTVQSVR